MRKLMRYETRLYLLENKEDVRNSRIIKKLKRRIALEKAKLEVA